MHPGHAKKPFKKTAHTTTWLGHSTADVQQFFFFSSVLAIFSIVRASVFTGFNNLKVMVVSFPPPPPPLCFCFQRALRRCPGPALIFRIGHELLDTALTFLSRRFLPPSSQTSPTPLLFSSTHLPIGQQYHTQCHRCE